MAAPIVAAVLVFAFAGASFFFALAETALFSLGKWQVRQLAERYPRRGGMVARLLSEPQDLLATMVLGNTFASAAMQAVAFWMALRGRWPLLPTTGALFVLILFVGEVLPKTLAVRAPEVWSLRVARLLQLVERFAIYFRLAAQQINTAILQGLTRKSPNPPAGFTDEEYQELVELAFQQGTLAQSEKETILQIIALDRRTVREVMRPRTSMACISDDLSVEEMIEAARKYRHRRLPIYDETPDTIVGILNTRALMLNPQLDLAEAVEFPSFVPGAMNLRQLLTSLQRQKRGMAIVLDEFGGTAGLVTIEDILEEVIGRIRPEIGAEGFVMEKLAPGRWRVNGTMRLDDFRREYPALRDVPEVETMGGLLVQSLGVVPAVGESATVGGLKLTANAADERRVREVIVEQVK